jgi:antibiotic biosynthesis monooxygenase (ABM) superfamily enzyme
MKQLTGSENQLVTAVISHRVKRGKERDYEKWLEGIAAAARQFDGHLGVNIFRPQSGVSTDYTIVLKFDRCSHLQAWLESETRKIWIERVKSSIEQPENIQILTGLETWFRLPGQPLKAPPPRYKMALVTWLGVFIAVAIFSRLLHPLLADLPLLFSQFITTGLVVAFLTYFLMPRLTRLFHRWLYSKN